MKTLATILLIALIATAHATSISSKSSGGNWEDANTWNGGAIPGASDDVTINGTVSVTSSSSTCHNIIISAGAFLQNGGGLGWVSLHVTNNATNNGTIRNNPTANTFGMEVAGDVANNSVWQQSNTYLPVNRNQSLTLASGMTFDGAFQRTNSGGYIDTTGTLLAASDLVFTGQFDMEWRSFDMAQHALTIRGNTRGLSWGTILNPTSVTLQNEAYFTNVTVRGTFTLHGSVQVDGATTFDGNITNADSLMNHAGLGWVTLIALHNVTNNGVICNNPRGNSFGIEVDGDLLNNAIWNPSNTYLASHTIQTLSLAAGKTFDGAFQRTTSGGYVDTNGTLKAGTNLVFTNQFDMEWRTFDMAGHALTIRGAVRGLSWGTIQNVGDLYFEQGGFLLNVTCVGNMTLYGVAGIDGAVHFAGTVTIADTMQQSGGLGWVTPTFDGAVINNGVVRDNPNGNGLTMDCSGDIINNGIWKCGTTYLDGIVRRTVQLAGAQTSVRISGAKVMFAADNVVPNFNMSSSGVAIVSSGSSLTIESGVINWGGLFNNYGRIVLPIKTTTSRDYDFYSGHLQFTSGQIPDSVIVESYGYQAPAGYGNAVRLWWRMRTVPPSPARTLSTLRLYYAGEQLGQNDEAALEMMQSTNGGATFAKISTTSNESRDTVNNYLSLSSANAAGDFVLTSNTTPAAGKPNVTVSVIAREAVRVNRPNRCIVYLVNNSDAPTDDFMVSVNTGSKTHIMSAELPVGQGQKEIVPIDSMLFEGGVDSCATFYIPGLGGHEDATFDVIVTAEPIGIIKQDGHVIQFEPVSMIVGAAVVYVGVKVIDYIGDKAVEQIDKWDVLTPEQQKAAKQLGIGQAKQDIQRDKSRGKTVWILRKVGVKVAEKLMGAVTGTVETGAAILRNIGKVGTSMRTKMWQWLYRESGLYGVEETQSGPYNPEYTGAEKKMRAVTSCDPNEKVGPAGFGDAGYLSSIGPMQYTIFFENKKEATAPAERILILDTLNANFDPATVVFGATSHVGFTTTLTNNILRWEISGIELPPNVTPPEGEGYVSFTVTPRAGLASGTVLKNRSTIIFDANAPIPTNEYSNTLDLAAPTTTLSALPTQINASHVTLKWNATDPLPGSGADAVTVFMSENGGGFVPVGVAGPLDSIVVPIARSGHYAFYALSRDMAGNVEASPTITRQTDVTVTNVATSAIPDNMMLITARPVPAWGPVQIEVTMERAMRGSIALYNVLGQRVAVLYNGVLDQGTRAFAWDGSAQPAGIYRAVVTAASGSRTATVVILH